MAGPPELQAAVASSAPAQGGDGGWLTLREAFERYSNADDLRALEEVEVLIRRNNLPAGHERGRVGSDRLMVDDEIEALRREGRLDRLHAREAKLRGRLHREFTQRLLDGSLEVSGCELPRRLGSRRRVIPLDTLRQLTLNYGASHASGHGLELAGIRVRRRAGTAASQTADVAAQRAGRPPMTWPWFEATLKERAQAGKTLPSLKGECAELHRLAIMALPHSEVPAFKTIYNKLGKTYRAALDRSPAQNPQN